MTTAMLGPVSVWEDHGAGHSGTLPSDWYTSRELFELEQRTFMRKVWHCVGSAHQVKEPGMYFTTTVANEEIVVARGGDGELRALSNVCLHRAGPVAVGTGKRNAFQCPYHGWLYELDGRLRRAQGMETTEGFDGSEMSLPQFRAEQWGPSVWVALDDDTPPLAEWLADVTPRLANYDIESLDFIGGRRWSIACNWKLYVDNYMEGYHIPFIHPGLALGLHPTIYTYELGGYSNVQYGAEPHPRGPGSRVSGILGGTQEFRRLKPPMAGLDEKERTGYHFCWVFPLTTVNFMPDGILMMLIRPVEPELTESTFLWWMPKATGFQDKMLQAALVNFGHVVNTEDYEICEQTQRGMRSSVYRQGRYNADQEICLHHFHRLLHHHMQPHLLEWQAAHAHTNGSSNGHGRHAPTEVG